MIHHEAQAEHQCSVFSLPSLLEHQGARIFYCTSLCRVVVRN